MTLSSWTADGQHRRKPRSRRTTRMPTFARSSKPSARSPARNFVLDPRVKAQVTMLSSAPMTPDAFYEAFLSILQVYGFVAVPSGNLIKILPDANARQVPGAESGSPRADRRPMTSSRRSSRSTMSPPPSWYPILRPLIPQYGHLAAHPASNMLIISDRAANVERMLRIIRRIDQATDDDFDVIRLQHASASEIVRVVNSLNQGARADGDGRRADDRRGRRPHQQRADRRRQEQAPADSHADHAPRHAARGRRRHARAVPALRRRRRTGD